MFFPTLQHPSPSNRLVSPPREGGSLTRGAIPACTFLYTGLARLARTIVTHCQPEVTSVVPPRSGAFEGVPRPGAYALLSGFVPR